MLRKAQILITIEKSCCDSLAQIAADKRMPLGKLCGLLLENIVDDGLIGAVLEDEG